MSFAPALADGWALTLDEDAFFSDLSTSLPTYLAARVHGGAGTDEGRRLGAGDPRQSGASQSLLTIRRSRDPSMAHRAMDGAPCMVVGKDVAGFAGCNAGTVLMRRCVLQHDLNRPRIH